MYLQESFGRQTNWLLGVFLILTLCAGVYSELFQAPQQSLDQQALYQNPLNKTFLDKVTAISYASRVENVVIQKNTNAWSLTSPRKILADNVTVNRLLESLQGIKVRKIYPKDTINISNFSLNDPLLKLKLESNEKVIEADIGIINPVDQSAYLTTSDIAYILQIEILKFPIETFGLSDFIDSRIITLDQKQLKEVKIFRGKRKGSPWIHLSKKSSEWKSSNKRELNQEKIGKYLTALLGSRSHTIFDELTEKQEETIVKFFERPSFTVVIKTTENQTFEYVFGSIYREIAELKIEKKKHVMIKSNQRHNFLLADKDVLKILRKNLSNFYQRRI